MRATVFAVCVLLAGCSGREGAPSRLARDETLVQVSATGQSEARPDEARLTLGVETRGGNAAEASAANARKMNAVMTALRRFTVADKDLQTRNLTLQRVDYGPERGRFIANNLLEVRLRAVDRAGEVVGAVSQAGANVIAGPDFRVSDPEAASRGAYAAAYRAARARAEGYAQAAGLKIKRVISIRDGSTPVGTVDSSAMYEERAAPAPVVAAPPVSPGTNRGTATVRVEFAFGN